MTDHGDYSAVSAVAAIDADDSVLVLAWWRQKKRPVYLKEPVSL